MPRSSVEASRANADNKRTSEPVRQDFWSPRHVNAKRIIELTREVGQSRLDLAQCQYVSHEIQDPAIRRINVHCKGLLSVVDQYYNITGQGCDDVEI